MFTFVLAFSAAARAPSTGSPSTVSVTVVDAATGAPVVAAQLVSAEARERFPVNGAGAWDGQMLYLPDGTERPFEPGLAFDLLVVAPGYLPEPLPVVVGRGRRTALRVSLRRLAWTPGPGAPEIESRVFDEVAAWAAAPFEERERARRRVASLVEDWVAFVRETGADPAAAEAVCRSAAMPPDRCDP